MKVDFMRFVDKWAGILLCFVLSGINTCLRPFSRSTSAEEVRKIAIIQISERGAVLLAHSALVKLKELFPQSELYYVIFEEMQESIRLLKSVPEENIFTIRAESLWGLMVSTLRVIGAVRREKVDAVLDLELFSRISTIVSYLSGAPIRVGFDRFHMEGLYRGGLQTHRVGYNHLKHISYNFLSLAYALKEDPENIPLSKIKALPEDIRLPVLPSTRDEEERMLEKLSSFCPEISRDNILVVINPNGSDLLPLRRWPMDNYIGLARKLLEHPSLYIAITGSSSEKRDAAMICDALQNRRCINLAGETTFRELVDLYNLSDLLLSNDSGPPNLASMTNTRTLVFFGPETPVCYKPLGDKVEALYADFFCSPCVSAYNHRKSACRDNKCLQAITVNDVYMKIKTILAHSEKGLTTDNLSLNEEIPIGEVIIP